MSHCKKKFRQRKIVSKESLQTEIKIKQYEYSQTCLPNPIPSSIFLLEADSNPFQQFHVFFLNSGAFFLLHMQAYIYIFVFLTVWFHIKGSRLLAAAALDICVFTSTEMAKE